MGKLGGQIALRVDLLPFFAHPKQRRATGARPKLTPLKCNPISAQSGALFLPQNRRPEQRVSIEVGNLNKRAQLPIEHLRGRPAGQH